MIYLEAETDVGTLALWDMGHQLEHLAPLPNREFQAAITQDSKAARLIYIGSDIDLGCRLGLFFKEEPHSPNIQPWYYKVDRKLYLHAPSGRLCFAGLEFYRRETPHVVHENSIGEIDPGLYRVQAYVRLDDEDDFITEQLCKLVGREEYRYYRSRSTGCLLSAIALGLGFITSLAWSWLAMGIAILFSILYIGLQTRRNELDTRYQNTAQHIQQWYQQHPELLFQLEKTEQLGMSDGSIDIGMHR